MAEILIDDVLLREPNLAVPSKRPIGNVRYDPTIGIKKEFFILYPSGHLGLDSFKDLTGKRTVSVSMNHSLPYEHWFEHPQGIHCEYGGDYNLAECLLIGGAFPNVAKIENGDVIVYGATFTAQVGLNTGSSDAYYFVTDSSFGTAGHVDTPYNSLVYMTDTTIAVVSCNAVVASVTFTVPNMRDGKPHTAIGRMWNDLSGTAYAQLILDGVDYGIKTYAKAPFARDSVRLFTAGSVHHNRTLDGQGHSAFVAYNASVEQCIAESLDPYMSLIPV